MLSAEAYSFQLKSRLAISLSWVAGYTNVLALLVMGHVVSHVTGNTTSFSAALAAGDGPAIRLFAWLLGTFLGGSVASAVMTEVARRRGSPSKYVLPISVEALLLTVFALGVDWHQTVPLGEVRTQFWMCGVAALAMGLQNATITKISGAVVRTTHLTGVITDIGLEGVQLFLWWLDQVRTRRASRVWRTMAVTRRHPTFLRVVLLTSIFGSFIFGAMAGALAFRFVPPYSMIAPVLFLLWIILVDWRHPIADVKELDPLSDPELKAAGIVKSLLPPELGIYHLAFHAKGPHRAPNFSQWAQRLPRRWRVVILTVSPLIEFNPNAALNLRAAAEHLRRRNRRLILAGVTPIQFRILDHEGLTDVVEAGDLCTDLEFAIARALDLLHDPVTRPRAGTNLA